MGRWEWKRDARWLVMCVSLMEWAGSAARFCCIVGADMFAVVRPGGPGCPYMCRAGVPREAGVVVVMSMPVQMDVKVDVVVAVVSERVLLEEDVLEVHAKIELEKQQRPGTRRLRKATGVGQERVCVSKQRGCGALQQ